MKLSSRTKQLIKEHRRHIFVLFSILLILGIIKRESLTKQILTSWYSLTCETISCLDDRDALVLTMESELFDAESSTYQVNFTIINLSGQMISDVALQLNSEAADLYFCSGHILHMDNASTFWPAGDPYSGKILYYPILNGDGIIFPHQNIRGRFYVSIGQEIHNLYQIVSLRE